MYQVKHFKQIISESIKKFILNEEGDKFKPTVEWMAKWYDIMNAELFGGILGKCKFEPFTTGKGQGNWLGRFQVLRPIKVESRSRRMFYSFWGEKTYITKDNFVTVCDPCIGLNINYSATEEGWLATLVHEMCHYYTYMYGYAPKQAHGVEFREIGERVSYRSNGRFTVQRLAGAEQMKEFEMDQAMIDKKTKRTMIVVMFMCDGVVRFIPTSSEKLIDEILMIERRHGSTRCDEIRIYVEPSVANEIFKIMKFKNLRSYKFYHIENKPQVLEILNNHTYSVPFKTNSNNN